MSQTVHTAPTSSGQQPLAPAQTEPPAAADENTVPSTDNAAPVRPNAALLGQGPMPNSEEFLDRLSRQAAKKDIGQEAQAAQAEGSQLTETSAAAGPAVKASVTGAGVDGEGTIAAAPAGSSVQDQELEHDHPAAPEVGTSWVTGQAHMVASHLANGHTAAAGVPQNAGIPFGASGASSGDIFGDDLPPAMLPAARQLQQPDDLYNTKSALPDRQQPGQTGEPQSMNGAATTHIPFAYKAHFQLSRACCTYG